MSKITQKMLTRLISDRQFKKLKDLGLERHLTRLSDFNPNGRVNVLIRAMREFHGIQKDYTRTSVCV